MSNYGGKSRFFLKQITLAIKFIVAIFLFTGAFKTARSQSDMPVEEVDSLKKYSYNISGIYVDSIYTTNYTATGFFTTINNKLSFITAAHVLSGCKNSLAEKKYFPKTMDIYFNTESGHFTTEKIAVNIAPFRDTGVCPAIKYPDITSYPVPDSVKEKIFTIDALIKDDVSGVNGMLKIFGFPVNRNIEKPGYRLRESSPIIIKDYQVLDSVNFINDNTELEVDSTNFVVIPKDIRVDSSLNGYSGSPVFEFNEDRWRFIGLLMGANTIRKYLVIVKPKYLEETRIYQTP